MNADLEIFKGGLVSSGGGPAEPSDAMGVFETLAVEAGRPAFFSDHVARFASGCAYYGLKGAPGLKELRVAAERLIVAQGCLEGVLRWSAWRGASQGEGWRMRLEPLRPDSLKPVWQVGVSSIRLPPPGPEAMHKHLGRRLWLEALAAGRAEGLEDVLLADGAGRLVESARANVFVVAGGVVKTPSLECGPLPGTVRARVLVLARELGFAAAEGSIPVAELGLAEEVFLTNALIGVRPVSVLDGRALRAPGNLTVALRDAWKNLGGGGI